MIVFNLIPTEPDEYKIYADWLEDEGVILTTAIRKGILPFDECSGISLLKESLEDGLYQALKKRILPFDLNGDGGGEVIHNLIFTGSGGNNEGHGEGLAFVERRRQEIRGDMI